MSEKITKKQWNWDEKHSFPIGRYCFEYNRASGMEGLKKDCSNCTGLKVGKCLKRRNPNIVWAKEVLVPKELKL